jgi:hypothetical protein
MDKPTVDSTLHVKHIYDHEAHDFELRLEDAIQGIASEGGVIGDIKYSVDPSTDHNKRGGFGALIIYETTGPVSS